jgi:hypothetical protein
MVPVLHDVAYHLSVEPKFQMRLFTNVTSNSLTAFKMSERDSGGIAYMCVVCLLVDLLI